MVVGTPGYLAPEQLSGDPLTPAVDIFAWGATMVFAATGHSPFEGDTLPVIINRILNSEPDLSRLSHPLRGLVAAALNKSAPRRPAAHQLLLQLLSQAGVSAKAGADRDELLQEGTQLAAKMPAPARPVTPNPPIGRGTPPQWQTPMRTGQQQPWQTGRPAGQPYTPPTPPPYVAPPTYAAPGPGRGTGTTPARGSTASGAHSTSGGRRSARGKAPIFIVIAAVAAVAIGLGVAAALGAFKGSSKGVPSAFVGTWSGTVNQPGGQVSSYPFSVTMTSGSYDGTISLINGCSGTTTEAVGQSSATSLTMNYVLSNTNGGVCLKQGSFTVTPDGSTALTLHLTARQSPSQTVTASGTLDKQ
jgi:hypothetical protein